MKLLLLCGLIITKVICHPVQDEVNEYDYTCDYLSHHLEFLQEVTEDCMEGNLESVQGN